MGEKQVFISYKSEEFDEANWVKTVLETNGISCWMAPMCITGGSSYAVEIPQAIRNCKVFVLILSEKSQTSKWVPREVDQAINENKIIMPFMLENCKLKDDFNFYLTNVQRYAAYESKVVAIEKMLREIKAILGIKEAPQQEAPQQAAPKQAVSKQAVSKQVAPQQETQKREIPQQAEPKQEAQKRVTLTLARLAKRETRRRAVVSITGGIVAAIVLLVGIVLLVDKLSHVTIAGEKVKKSAFSVHFREATVTQEDLELISELKDVRDVNFYNCIIENSDLSVLSSEKIAYLTMEDCSLTEAMVATLDFEKMTDLGHLNLSENPSLTKIDGIEEVADTLRHLAINQTNITNLDFLKDFTNLEDFEADDTGIESIEVLGACKKLYTISLNGNKLKSLKGLENTIYLKSIDAGYNELTDIKELSNNVLLYRVYLNHNQITDLSALKNANAELESLYIDDNQISDISCLEGFSALKYFSADRNAIADISALNQATELKEITITSNKLTSLHGLENCMKLECINVSDNQISDASALFHLPLTGTFGAYVNLGNNKITEMTLKNAKDLSFLNLHGNAIPNFTFGESCVIDTLIYDYKDTIDFEQLAKESVRFHYIVDCPLDKRVDLRRSLGSMTPRTPDELHEIPDYEDDIVNMEDLYTPPEA